MTIDIATLGFKAETGEIGKYDRAMDRAAQTGDKLQARVDKIGATISKLGVAAGKVAGIIAALGVSMSGLASLKTNIAFEKQMSAVAAVTRATKDEIDQLSRTARDLGSATAFSATQAAAAMENLGRAGFSTNEILGAIKGNLDLAAAGNVDLARAAEISANVIRGFNLNASESGRVSDVLAAAAARANLGISDLGEAMKFAAPTAQALGLSLEETTAVIGKLADAGLAGGIGGRAFQSLSTRLIQERDKITEIIGDFDLQVEGLTGVFKRLAAAGITNVQAVDIFSAENLDAFTIVKNAAIATTGSIEDLQAALQSARGEAERMANIQFTNTAGSLDELGGAIEELFLNVGEGGFLNAFRGAIDDATAFLRTEGAAKVASAISQMLAGAINTSRGAFDLIGRNMDALVNVVTAGVAVMAGRLAAPIAAAFGAQIVASTRAVATAFAAPITAVRAYALSVEQARAKQVQFAVQNYELAKSEVAKAQAMGATVAGIRAQQAAYVGLAAAQSRLTAANTAFAAVAARTDAINRGFAAGASLTQRAAGAAALAFRGLATAGSALLSLFGGPLGLAITAVVAAFLALSRIESRTKIATDELARSQASLADAFRSVKEASGQALPAALDEFTLAAERARVATNELIESTLETRKRGFFGQVGVVIKEVVTNRSGISNIKNELKSLPTGLEIDIELNAADFNRDLDAFLRENAKKLSRDGKIVLDVEYTQQAINAVRTQGSAIAAQVRDIAAISDEIITKSRDAAKANEILAKGQAAFDAGVIDQTRLDLLKQSAETQGKALDDLRLKFEGLTGQTQTSIDAAIVSFTNLRSAIEASTQATPENLAAIDAVLAGLGEFGTGVAAAIKRASKEGIDESLQLTATIDKVTLSTDAQRFIDGLPKQLAEIETKIGVADGLFAVDQTDIKKLAEVQTRLELIGKATADGLNFKTNPEVLDQINEIAEAAGRLAAKEYRIRFVAGLDQSLRDIESELQLNVKLAGIDPRDVDLIERTRVEFDLLREASIAFGPNIPNDVLEKIERYGDLVAQARREQEALNAAQDFRSLARDFGQDAAGRAYDRQISTLRESLAISDKFAAIEFERVAQIRSATAELERQKSVLATINPNDAGYSQMVDAIAEAEVSLGRLSSEITAQAIEDVRRLREEISTVDDVLIGAVDDIFDGKFSFKSFFKDIQKAAVQDFITPIKTSIQQSIREGLFGKAQKPPIEPRSITGAIEGGANAANFAMMSSRLEASVAAAVKNGIGSATGDGFGFGGRGFSFGAPSQAGESLIDFLPKIDLFKNDLQGAFDDINIKPLALDFGKEFGKSTSDITFDTSGITSSFESALFKLDFDPISKNFSQSIGGELERLGVVGFGGPLGGQTPAQSQTAGIFDGLKSIFSNGFSGIGKTFSSIFGSGGPLSGIGKAVSGVSSALGGALGGVTKAIGGIGGAIGGAIGAVSAALGPIGGVVQGVVAAVNIFKGLFGKPSDKVGQVAFDVGTGKVIGTGTKDQSAEALENLKIAESIQTSISEIVRGVLSAAGGAITDKLGTSFYENLFNIAVGSRDGIRIGFQGLYGDLVQPQKFERSESGALSAIQAGVKLALKNIVGGDQGIINDFLAMKEITTDMVNEFIRAAERRSELEAEFLTYLKGTAGETLRAYNELQKRQRAERAEVQELGGFSQAALLGFEIKLQNERVKFLSELSTTQREALREVVSSTEFALADLLSLVNTEIENVADNVATTADAFDRAKQSIRDFLKEFDFGQFSGLSIREKLDKSLSEFQSTLARARIGDTEALSQITTIANRTLGFASELYTSGPRFQDIKNQIIAGIKELDALKLPEPIIPETSTIVNELQGIKDLVNLAIDSGAGTFDFSAVREALANASTLDPDLVERITSAIGIVEGLIPQQGIDPVGNAIALQGSQISSAILSQSPYLAQIAYNTGLLVGGTNDVATNTNSINTGLGAIYDATVQQQTPGSSTQPAPVTVAVGVAPQATATTVFNSASRNVGSYNQVY